MYSKLLLSLVLLVVFGVSALAQEPPHTKLKVGDPAPEFSLRATDGKIYKLSDFKGKKEGRPAVFFLGFPGGWTQELKAYQADIAKLESTDTQVFGLSVDSVPANREFAKQLGITFPLLSDFKRTVVKDYGVFNEEQGFGNRATFVIDKEGVIQHIDEGNVAIDPTSVVDTCNVLLHKKAAQ